LGSPAAQQLASAADRKTLVGPATELAKHQEHDVAKIEEIELQAHRDAIVSDVRRLVEKYRKIFDWDVPDIDQTVADRLILGEVRHALEDIEKTLLR
jgi:hypothetical protein